LSYEITAELSKYIMNSVVEPLDKDKLIDIVLKLFKSYDIPIYKNALNEIIELVSDKIISTINLSNNSIVREIISRYFDKIFFGQINCLNKEESEAKLELIIKSKKINVSFKNNECITYEPAYNILHEAFYIDNPFVIDEISAIPRSFYNRGSNDIKNHIIFKLMKKTNIMDGVISAVIAKEKLEEIYKVLNKVVAGNIVVNSGTYGLDAHGFSEPIKLANLSTGLKSFVIIKMLLEKGILKEKDIIILDEPEIHLHPEWQLTYAEIIVLLQKVFDLSIIVTTHSSNFLESIDYFSRKYSIDTKCKYYLSTSKNGINSFEDVTENLDKIYAQMIESSVLLDKLKYEMENDANE
jgi:AAA15 family ATPase/GTPase